MSISVWDAKIAKVYYDERTDRADAIQLLWSEAFRQNRVNVWLTPGLASAIHVASLEAAEGRLACEQAKLVYIAPEIMEEV